MRNFIQAGAAISLIAQNDTASGEFVVIGGLSGVATGAAAAGETVTLQRGGVFDLPKVSAEAWSVGDKVYWKADVSKFTKTATGNRLAGVAVVAAADPSEVGTVCLDGMVR